MEDKKNLTDNQAEFVSDGDIGIQRKESIPVKCSSCQSENIEFLRIEYDIFHCYRCKDCGTEFKTLG